MNNDPSKKGRVKVLLADFGWDTSDMAIWCWPRQGNGMSIPAVGDYVEIYFLRGDSTYPVYLFPAAEIKGNTPDNFDGLPSTHVLFEDPLNKNNYIKLDTNKSTLDIKVVNGKINMLSATDKFVLGDKLDTWIQNTLIIWLNTHTHPTAGTGPPSAPTTPTTGPTSYLSNDIKGS